MIYMAKDSDGDLYITDERDCLPSEISTLHGLDMTDKEFRVNNSTIDTVRFFNRLSQTMEFHITIQVGEFYHETD